MKPANSDLFVDGPSPDATLRERDLPFLRVLPAGPNADGSPADESGNHPAGTGSSPAPATASQHQAPVHPGPMQYAPAMVPVAWAPQMGYVVPQPGWQGWAYPQAQQVPYPQAQQVPYPQAQYTPPQPRTHTPPAPLPVQAPQPGDWQDDKTVPLVDGFEPSVDETIQVSIPELRRRGIPSSKRLYVPAPEKSEPEPEVSEVDGFDPQAVLAEKLPPQLPWFRRMWASERMMHFNRLLWACLAVNGWLLYEAVEANLFASAEASFTALSNLVIGNFAVAILIRQQNVVNLLFWFATRVPTSWPLKIRASLAKVYHFGGIHVGAAIAGTLWFVALTAQMIVGFALDTLPVSIRTMGITGSLLAILVAICFMSMPKRRQKYHDAFEHTKRFGGWASLGLFWAQTISVIIDTNPGVDLFTAMWNSPHCWLLALITFSVALPWMRLRRVKVDLTVPSNHVAIAKFNHGVTPFPGSATTVSRSPLGDWHSFANVPSPGRTGFRLTISRAGDWTGQLIDDKPSHLWVRGIPTAGVANIEVNFKRVVYVATGSGIGPCLPHLLAGEVPAQLVWSTRSPRETYGDELVDEILEAVPNAVIWDTNKHGKPDMMKLAYKAVQDFDAEAVICISNKKLTWQVVYGMESRNIPAYGAIWDS